jgi:hypothetical protein
MFRQTWPKRRFLLGRATRVCDAVGLYAPERLAEPFLRFQVSAHSGNDPFSNRVFANVLGQRMSVSGIGAMAHSPVLCMHAFSEAGTTGKPLTTSTRQYISDCFIALIPRFTQH